MSTPVTVRPHTGTLVPPSARHVSRSALAALAAVPLLGFTTWACWHLYTVLAPAAGHGGGLAVVFAVSFLLLWWVPLSWWERPAQTTPEQDALLDQLTVVVQVPVYNEDPAALRACLDSVLNQSRRPQRVRVLDDGSTDPLEDIRDDFLTRACHAGVDARWQRTTNRGKRYAQMTSLADDDSDIVVTLDSDSILDQQALREGLKPFVAVLNTRRNWLTRLTSVLYIPFTRGFRSAQSVLGRVMINSGTLALYRGDVLRPYHHAYPQETFRSRPMQMNDDSLMTLYGLLHGRTVHQPSCVAYTLVPDTLGQYRRQQMRWMRGTFIRTFWWFRYARSVLSPVFWIPLIELIQLSLAICAPILLLADPRLRDAAGSLLLSTVLVGVGINWLTSLRYIALRRSDESVAFQLALVLCSPLAGAWRTLVVRPMHLFALATFWRVDSWGTRKRGVEVAL
ncbi:glycosyltransferase [Streptomyces sp. NPDC005963]|uniref:glycosyltransferase n=1 Tax=Streptomyces sp. NPDC005963 TaxID=3156721 RepID=UPI003408B869